MLGAGVAGAPVGGDVVDRAGGRGVRVCCCRRSDFAGAAMRGVFGFVVGSAAVSAAEVSTTTG